MGRGVNRRRALDRRMRQVLLRLELLSHGSTQAWNSSGSHAGEPDDGVVALVCRGEPPPHEHWRAVYERQRSDEGRLAVLCSARAELRAWTRRAAPPASGKSLVELLIEDGEGHDARAVAERFGVAPSYVRRCRVRAGRDSEDGRVLGGCALDAGERARRARELRARGLTLRQIALHLGCSLDTVRRDVGSNALASDAAARIVQN